MLPTEEEILNALNDPGDLFEQEIGSTLERTTSTFKLMLHSKIMRNKNQERLTYKVIANFI